MVEDAPHCVIIGAGFGGLGCAHSLIRSGLRVTIIDAKNWFTVGGTWQYVWSSRVSADDAKWSLSEAKLPGVNLRLNTKVASLDLKGKCVKLGGNDERVYFDHLVLSPGVVGDASSVPGLEEAVDMYNFDSTTKQEEDLKAIVADAKAGKNVCLHIPIAAVPYKCPVAPFEAAFLVDDRLQKEGCRDRVRIVVSSPVEWPLPDGARPVFERMLSEKNVELIAANGIIKLDGNAAVLADGTTVDATHTWAVYKQVAPDFIRNAGLTDPRGFVPVDIRSNLVSGSDNVYCIGDCCGIMVGGKPHPKAGEFAWQMGSMVANLILKTSGFKATRLGACIAECGKGAGVLVAPDFTDVIVDPEGGKPKCTVAEKERGEDDKIAWVNKYISTIFGEGGRAFAPAPAVPAVTA